MASVGFMIVVCLIGIAFALVAGFALPRRFRDWPAVIVLATVGGLVVGIWTTTRLIPFIGTVLSFPSDFIAVHTHDRWARLYPDGPPEPSQAAPIVLSIAIGLLVGCVAWFLIVGATRLGMLLRTSAHHDALR